MSIHIAIIHASNPNEVEAELSRLRTGGVALHVYSADVSAQYCPKLLQSPLKHALLRLKNDPESMFEEVLS